MTVPRCCCACSDAKKRHPGCPGCGRDSLLGILGNGDDRMYPLGRFPTSKDTWAACVEDAVTTWGFVDYDVALDAAVVKI